VKKNLGEGKILLDLETIVADRSDLQRRWSALGYFPDKTISQALAEGIERHPDVRCVFYANAKARTATNRDLYREGLRLAGALRQLGLGRGDVVALQLPTWYETAVLYHAVFHIGAVVLPMIHIYGPAEVAFILEQSKAKAFVTPDIWRGVDYLARCAAYREIPTLDHIVCVGEATGQGVVRLCDLNSRRADDFGPDQSDPNDICLLMYTSGTTSAPKGVRHTHNTLLREWGRPTYANRGLYLSSLPAGHYTGFGYLMRPSIYGASTVFMDHWEPKFAAELIQRHKVKHSGGTPIFLLTLARVAEENGLDLSSLESFGMGGASITPSQIELADKMGFPAARVYGSTEHPTVTCFDPDAPFEKRAYTDGKLDEGNAVRVVDDSGHDLPRGGEGEILTIGPELFVGYSDPELDKESFLPGGWFRTGDIGRLDADGYLVITDRKKDIIIRGGENISSKAVEEILSLHEAVAEAAVTAMPDPTYGEKVCAFVIPKPGRSLSLEEVIAHFGRSGVARQITPERLEIVDSFPRTPSGKVKKFELAKRLARGAVGPSRSKPYRGGVDR